MYIVVREVKGFFLLSKQGICLEILIMEFVKSVFWFNFEEKLIIIL